MGNKSKGSRRKQSTKFAIKGPATSLKKARSGDSKSKQQSTNIEININTKNLTVLTGRRRRRGQVLASAPSSAEPISSGFKNESNRVDGQAMNEVDNHHRKKGKQEWNSNYETLVERGYAASVRSHSLVGKRRCSNRKHNTANSRDSSSVFHFQAASFSADKTTNEILNDTTSTLSTIHLIPSAESQYLLEPCQTANTTKDQGCVLSSTVLSLKQENSPVQNKNRFDVLNNEIEDGSPGDSKQPSLLFVFHPPSFSLTSESSLPTALLSQLHMQNTTDDIDPDL
jgi:hypothetical protein